MPFLCCGSKKEDVVETATDSPSPKQDEDKKQKTTSNKQGETNESEEEREKKLAESIYHDARSSLTESMMYRPARSVIGKIPNIRLCLDHQPEVLLSQISEGTGEGEGSGEQGSAGGGARDSVIASVLGESVVGVTEDLTNQQLELQPGYPGSLTTQELEACLEFRKLVKQYRSQESSYFEMVHIMQGVEEEAFAICRIMRSRKFQVQEAINLMTGNIELWKQSKQYDFYPNLQSPEGLGAHCPMSMVHTQLPIVQYGLAKNGSLVFYLPVNMISLEALDCLTDLENFQQYIWNLCAHAYGAYASGIQKQKKSKGCDRKNQSILAELTIIIDLNGLKRSLFTERVINVLKKVVAVLNCFPEFLNKAMLLNAPYFFSAIWLIFRQLMDARTVAKIDIFSTERAGKACLLEYIDPEELLSDYDGEGWSYMDVLHNLRHPGTTRQMVERFFFDGSSKKSNTKSGGEVITYQFELNDKEKASIFVFTRSTVGAHFTISSSSTPEEKGSKMEVKPPPSAATSSKSPKDKDNKWWSPQPYVVEVASNDGMLKGSGKFTVSAKCNNNHQSNTTKEYFLVQVRVYPM